MRGKAHDEAGPGESAEAPELSAPAPVVAGSVPAAPSIPASEGAAPAPGLEAVLRYRRRTLLLGAVLVASSYAIDVLQPRLREVAIVRALWIAAILACAAAQRVDRPRLATIASFLGAFATGIAVVAIVALNGGTASIYAGMLIATPFAVLVALFELPGAAALSGALCVLGGAAIRIHEGQPWSQIVSWLNLSIVMTALATWGTIAARRAWRIEVAGERARREAAERLAESERQRAEAERLAEVGRLTAQVAHELNSPLAVVKANVQWLGKSEAERDAAEQAEVVADTLRCVDRMAEAVQSVRRQAGELPLRKR
jgi:signal transduction histidine kinase